MTIKKTYVSVSGGGSGMDEILNVEITEAYKQNTAHFKLECRSYGTFTLNDQIIIDMGYEGDHANLMYGYIDDITATRRPGIYEVVGRDILKRAMEHWIVTTDLDNPWSRSNISAEALVGALLAEAGITNYSGDTSNFTYGTQYPVEFQLISSWDAIERISTIIAWRCFAKNGTVYFKDIRPVPGDSYTKWLKAGSDGSITNISNENSTDNLRNKVVVFGRSGIYASASESSPYLPEGFYKTAIVSSELIDTQSMADDAAD